MFLLIIGSDLLKSLLPSISWLSPLSLICMALLLVYVFACSGYSLYTMHRDMHTWKQEERRYDTLLENIGLVNNAECMSDDEKERACRYLIEQYRRARQEAQV